ncbi:RND transporter, partial [Massilia sp. CT11-108]
LFRAVDLGAGAEFFRRNGLLYLDAHEVRDLAARLVDARPLLGALARDPSLRGVANLLAVTLGTPLLTGQVTLAQMAPLLARSAATVEGVLAGRNTALSWQDLATAGVAAEPGLVEVRPVLDYAALLPGAASS